MERREGGVPAGKKTKSRVIYKFLLFLLVRKDK